LQTIIFDAREYGDHGFSGFSAANRLVCEEKREKLAYIHRAFGGASVYEFSP
jgi:hypothetical protein